MGREYFEDIKLPPLKKRTASPRDEEGETDSQRALGALAEEPTRRDRNEGRAIYARQDDEENTVRIPTHNRASEDESIEDESEGRLNLRNRNDRTDDNGDASVKDSSKFFDDFMEQDQNRGRKYAIWGIVFASVIVLGIAAMTYWGGAAVAVVARREKHPINTVLTAANKTASASATVLSTSIPFQRIAITREAGKKVEATGEEYVERKASGKIVIYNNYTSGTQRLIKNTRFETADGKIYRIRDSVTVPGKKGTVPGSIEAIVFADESGTNFNIGLTDFTIPGFKTDAGRFKNIYARSKTAMTGGAKGMTKIIDPAKLATVQEELTAELTDQIYKEIEAQTPDKYIFFRGSFPPVFEPITQEAGTDQSALIKQKAYLDGVIFNKDILAKALASATLDNYDGSGINILDWSNVTARINNKDRNRISDTDVITVTLNGSATFISTYDQQKIVDFLKGQGESKVKELLTEFPQIESAEAVIRPFWKTSFPVDPSKIRVYEALPEGVSSEAKSSNTAPESPIPSTEINGGGDSSSTPESSNASDTAAHTG